MDLNVLVPGYVIDKFAHKLRNTFALPGFVQLQGVATQAFLLLDNVHLESLLGQIEAADHPCHPTADDQSYRGNRR